MIKYKGVMNMSVPEYQQRILKKLQVKELEILKDFQKICEENKLPYFATGGTAIGALRHEGFIPWDDDIDVVMLREDYEKFMKIAPSIMGEKYEFMTAETEEKYPLMFGKMILKGTRFVESAYEQANYPLGIFIDIFPYDKTSEDQKERKYLQKKTWFWGRMHVLSLITQPVLPDSLPAWKKKVSLLGCKCIHYLLKIIGMTPKKTNRYYLKWALKFQNSDSDLYIDYSYINSEKLMVRKKDIFPLIMKPFEDTTVSLVREYDKFLRPDYGDYMKMPPEEERHNHYASFIDFGDEVVGNLEE